MTDYAVINPATGETVKEYPTISDERPARGDRRGRRGAPRVGAEVDVAERAALVRRVGELHTERREELAEIIVREMGKPLEQALGEVDFCARHLRLLRRQRRRRCLADEPIKLLAGDGTAFDPAQLGRRAAGDHALELSRTTRWPASPGRTWSSATRSCSSTRRSAPSRRRRSSRSIDDAGFPEGAYVNIFATNEQIARRHRRPARPGRLADRLRAGRRRRRRDRRAAT